MEREREIPISQEHPFLGFSFSMYRLRPLLLMGKSPYSHPGYGIERPLNFPMASVHLREGINKVITMLTPLISSLMGFFIAFLYTMRIMVSYGTSLCINFFGLHPPCFHPGASRHHPAKVCRYRTYTPPTHQISSTQWPAKSASIEWLSEDVQKLDMAASTSTVHGDVEEAACWLVERENSLEDFAENLINDQASHEHVSTIEFERDMIVLSDDANDATECERDMIVLSDDANDAKDGIKNGALCLVDQVSGCESECNVFEPSGELLEFNARPTDVVSYVSEADLDSAKEIVVNKLDVHTCTPRCSLQETESNKKVSAQRSDGISHELDVCEMQKGVPCGLVGASLKLKQRLSAQRQALQTVHVLLERQRVASSVAAQESLATISMLQREKAALVLEVMQHQRMTEEKEMFDENVLIQLRDSLVKREAELLALEKEMELYRRKVVLRDQVATTDQKQVKSRLVNVEDVGQQHLLLEYPSASGGTKIGQHANVLREQSGSFIHPSSSISSEASTPGPDKETREVVDHASRHWASLDLRSGSMIKRDTSRVTLKKEASELLSRLQAIEADRELMRQTLELRRKEKWELRLLQEVIGALKSLHLSSGKRTTFGMHRACSVSVVEAEIFRSKRARCMEQ